MLFYTGFTVAVIHRFYCAGEDEIPYQNKPVNSKHLIECNREPFCFV